MTNESETGIEKLPTSIYLSLGSNLGDREANLLEAVDRIKALGIEIIHESSIYETEPVGRKNQPWFLNQVIEIRVTPELKFDGDRRVEKLVEVRSHDERAISPEVQVYELFLAFLDIEQQMGRERKLPMGPRLIDIDVLLCGDIPGFFVPTSSVGNDSEVTDASAPSLILPHPRMHLRRFVLEPLCEIAPDVVHPTLKKTFRELLSALDDPSTVRLYRRAKR